MPELRYLPSFRQELNSIVEYIAFTLEAPQAALNLLNKLETSLDSLKLFPLAHRLYRPAKPISTEYRVLTVGNYLVFYVALEDVIEIHRIIYKKRDLSRLVR